MQAPPDVAIALVNRPRSVGLVAAALEGVATALGLDALDLDAVQMAVTETCKNVVLHAYEGTEGPLEVEIRVLAEALEVTVTDHGIGIRPHIGERRQPHTGLGLPIIHVHCRRVAYTNLPGGGTEVRMELVVTPRERPAGAELALAVLPRVTPALPEVSGTVRVPLGALDDDDAEAALAALRTALGEAASMLTVERCAATSAAQPTLVVALNAPA